MNALMDIWTVFWRDWVVLRRRLTKFILSRMVAPMLYLVAFGWGLVGIWTGLTAFVVNRLVAVLERVRSDRWAVAGAVRT